MKNSLDLGLLLLRIALGGLFLLYAYGMLMSPPHMRYNTTLGDIAELSPEAWYYLALSTASIIGIMTILGLFQRIAILAGIIYISIVIHTSSGAGTLGLFVGGFLIVLLIIMALLGPGKYKI